MRAMEGSIEIGDRVSIQHFCAMYGHGRLEIGADVLIGPHCAIAVARHRVERLDIPVREQGVLRLDTHIGAGTWIGAHVTVFSGVRVGANAIIGAGAVVNRDIPDLAIAAGVPARVIRYRNA
ncbi:MAG: acyltransferase [Myxococcales bacterium]|nr:acyltransferase [Myxococcales bacterium]